MSVALKIISFAELLQTGGNGGVSGDTGRKATVHAGVPVPIGEEHPSPLALVNGGSGNAVNTGRDTQTQYSYGFQGDDPTVPTVPTSLQGVARQAASDP